MTFHRTHFHSYFILYVVRLQRTIGIIRIHELKLTHHHIYNLENFRYPWVFDENSDQIIIINLEKLNTFIIDVRNQFSFHGGIDGF